MTEIVKSRIAKGFDFLAPVYDQLARFIIGNEIVTSQLHFLHHLSSCQRLLVLGGGSGWILDYLCKDYPQLEIDYIDLSPRMIAAARSRACDNKRVSFIEGTEENIPDRIYDAVITNFYLDMFDDSSLGKVIEKISNSLDDQARWIVTDFVNEQHRHAILLWIMYRFFRVITGIKATRLIDWQSQMRVAGLELLESRKFKNEFIATNLYKKNSALSSFKINPERR